MSGQGWTLVAASGDGGATTDCAHHLSVSYPASDPDVTAAGGTTLEGGFYGYLAETGWTGGSEGCRNNDGGGGGGCSAYFPAPGYQSIPACGANSRSLPDLALNADWVNAPQEIQYLRISSIGRWYQHCSPGAGRVLRPGERKSPLYPEHCGQHVRLVLLCTLRSAGQRQLVSLLRGVSTIRAALSLLRHYLWVQRQRHYPAIRSDAFLRCTGL